MSVDQSGPLPSGPLGLGERFRRMEADFDQMEARTRELRLTVAALRAEIDRLRPS